MEPLLYVMAIMGCADSGDLCAEERVVEYRFTSAEACRQAMESHLILNGDLDYPVIRAECRRSTALFAQNGEPPIRR